MLSPYGICICVLFVPTQLIVGSNIYICMCCVCVCYLFRLNLLLVQIFMYYVLFIFIELMIGINRYFFSFHILYINFLYKLVYNHTPRYYLFKSLYTIFYDKRDVINDPLKSSCPEWVKLIDTFTYTSPPILLQRSQIIQSSL
jgi:hypothetical protein